MMRMICPEEWLAESAQSFGQVDPVIQYLQHNSKHAYSEPNPIVCNGTYSQESVYRIAA